MKSISILGSTGSIGTQTLQIIRENPQKYRVCALSCRSNTALLKEQVEEFLSEVIRPVLEENKEILGVKAEINV